jgi:hypothetical protein
MRAVLKSFKCTACGYVEGPEVWPDTCRKCGSWGCFEPDFGDVGKRETALGVSSVVLLLIGLAGVAFGVTNEPARVSGDGFMSVKDSRGFLTVSEWAATTNNFPKWWRASK